MTNLSCVIIIKENISKTLIYNLKKVNIYNLIISNPQNTNTDLNIDTNIDDKNNLFLLAKNKFSDKYILIIDSDYNINEYSLRDLIDFCKNNNNNYYNFSVNGKFQTILFNRKLEKINLKYLYIEYLEDNVEISEVDEYIHFTSTSSQKINSTIDISNLTNKDIFYIGHYFYKMNKISIAIDYLIKYVKTEKNTNELYYAYYYLGNIYLSLNFEDKAIRCYRKGQEMNNFGIEILMRILSIYDNDKYYMSCLENCYKTNSILSEWSDLESEKDKILCMYKFNEELYEESMKYGMLYLLKTENDEIRDIYKLCEQYMYISYAKKEKKEKITIAILAKDAENFLDLYLKCIYFQTWPKSLTKLYIRSNNNNDNTINILSSWIEKNKNEYDEIYVNFNNVDENVENYTQHEWNQTRFSVIAKIRQDSINWAKEKNTHYFTCDCDNFIIENTIESLFLSQKEIISPLLISTPHSEEPFTNYHTIISYDGSCTKDKYYIDIVNRKKIGLFEVPIVHCCYFIKNNVLKDMNYIEENQSFEYLVFSKNAREKNIIQYVDNNEYYGYITFSTNKEDLENEIWLKFLL